MIEKVYCYKCLCWIKESDVRGSCRRKAPYTSDMVPSIWPQTHPEDFCFEGIPKEKELLVENHD